MLKPILSILLPGILSWAGSPVSGYERIIERDGSVVYEQREGNFTLRPARLIDSENIYNGGTVDNYDDPYLRTNLAAQVPFRIIRGGHRRIDIVFNSPSVRDAYLRDPGLGMFRAAGLTIRLYLLDRARLVLPLRPSVYPLFVMGDRYVQGVMTPALLEGLIRESDYTPRPAIPLAGLRKRLWAKFPKTRSQIDTTYNDRRELFEVRKKGQKEIDAYVSRDGRYILIPAR